MDLRNIKMLFLEVN
jgi:hypothetical protein